MELKGKVAVVTGGARGLGFAVVHALLARGAKVALAARTMADAEAACASLSGEVKPFGCDVRDAEQVRALVSRVSKALGPIDLWVNGVGPPGPFGPARALSAADQREAIEATVFGAWLGTMAALEAMAARSDACIVNVVGRTEPAPRPPNAAWDASKAWVKTFTLALDEEQRDTGLRFIAFEPGLLESRSTLMPQVAAGTEEQLKARLSLLRLKAMPPELPAERLVEAIARGARGLVRGTPPLWSVRGPLRMVFGGRPDFVISPRVLPRR